MDQAIEIIIDSKEKFCVWDSVKNDQVQSKTNTVVSGRHAFFSLYDNSHDDDSQTSTPFQFLNNRKTEDSNSHTKYDFTKTNNSTSMKNFTNKNSVETWENVMNLV